MRDLLSNPDNGTAQVFMANDPIGVMPNLDTIIS
jgi:hypothetical protein